MKKAIALDVRLWIEGEDEPAHDFAASTTDPNVGYAIASTQILPDIQRAVGRTAAVSTEGCTR